MDRLLCAGAGLVLNVVSFGLSAVLYEKKSIAINVLGYLAVLLLFATACVFYIAAIRG